MILYFYSGFTLFLECPLGFECVSAAGFSPDGSFVLDLVFFLALAPVAPSLGFSSASGVVFVVFLLPVPPGFFPFPPDFPSSPAAGLRWRFFPDPAFASPFSSSFPKRTDLDFLSFFALLSSPSAGLEDEEEELVDEPNSSSFLIVFLA